MNKLEVAGRMVQWAIELSQFDIQYHPRTAIKAQVLADFIPSSLTRTRTASPTRQNSGQYKLMDRQPKRGGGGE